MLIDFLAEPVPSSARSTSSSAAPLPRQFELLLSDTLDTVKEVSMKTRLEARSWSLSGARKFSYAQVRVLGGRFTK